MPEPLLQASSSPLPPLRMSRCKIQAQRLSIAGSWLRASELKQRFFCAHPAGCHSLSRIDGPTVFEPASPH